MCEDQVGVSEVTIFVGLIGKVVSIGSSKIGPVLWQLELLMQCLRRQRFCVEMKTYVGDLEHEGMKTHKKL